MKTGIIDIGSNSVRLMVSDNGKTLLKLSKITRLAEGMGEKSILQKETVERTVRAVYFFIERAKELGAENIHAFATAAVRKARNRQYFIDEIKGVCGLSLDIVSGDMEAFLGASGALDGNDGCLIDIGGASSEIIVYRNGKITYSYSLDIGCVSLYGMFGENIAEADEFLMEKIKEYGNIPLEDCPLFYGIGGTITSCSAILQNLYPYDANKTHGYNLRFADIVSLKDRLSSMSVSERENIREIQKERAKVIVCGCAILKAIMEKLCAKQLTVSEKDNLDGYLKYITEKK